VPPSASVGLVADEGMFIGDAGVAEDDDAACDDELAAAPCDDELGPGPLPAAPFLSMTVQLVFVSFLGLS
jgi:hypothetical protein